MTTRDPAPWLALAATVLDGLRPSPARRALSVALQRYGQALAREADDLEAKASAARAKATQNHTETQALLALVKRG